MATTDHTDSRSGTAEDQEHDSNVIRDGHDPSPATHGITTRDVGCVGDTIAAAAAASSPMTSRTAEAKEQQDDALVRANSKRKWKWRLPSLPILKILQGKFEMMR